MLRKNLLRLIFLFALSITLYFSPSAATDLFFNDSIYSMIFTILTVLFFVGTGLIISFDLSNIKDVTYYGRIKDNLDSIFRRFLCFFMLSVVVYIIIIYIKNRTETYNVNMFNKEIDMYHCITCLMFSFLITASFYFVINFVQMYKLKNDITARLRQ